MQLDNIIIYNEFTIVLTLDDNNTLLATCPQLPEITTFGKNRADVIKHVENAIGEALAARSKSHIL